VTAPAPGGPLPLPEPFDPDEGALLDREALAAELVADLVIEVRVRRNGQEWNAGDLARLLVDEMHALGDKVIATATVPVTVAMELHWPNELPKPPSAATVAADDRTTEGTTRS
jgi:hypothetical protein